MYLFYFKLIISRHIQNDELEMFRKSQISKKNLIFNLIVRLAKLIWCKIRVYSHWKFKIWLLNFFFILQFFLKKVLLFQFHFKFKSIRLEGKCFQQSFINRHFFFFAWLILFYLLQLLINWSFQSVWKYSCFFVYRYFGVDPHQPPNSNPNL